MEAVTNTLNKTAKLAAFRQGDRDPIDHHTSYVTQCVRACVRTLRLAKQAPCGLRLLRSVVLSSIAAGTHCTVALAGILLRLNPGFSFACTGGVASSNLCCSKLEAGAGRQQVAASALVAYCFLYLLTTTVSSAP